LSFGGIVVPMRILPHECVHGLGSRRGLSKRSGIFRRNLVFSVLSVQMIKCLLSLGCLKLSGATTLTTIAKQTKSREIFIIRKVPDVVVTTNICQMVHLLNAPSLLYHVEPAPLFFSIADAFT